MNLRLDCLMLNLSVLLNLSAMAYSQECTADMVFSSLRQEMMNELQQLRQQLTKQINDERAERLKLVDKLNRCVKCNDSYDVHIPPEIIVQPQSDVVYRFDDEVLLECEARGVPQVGYYWKKNGNDFDFNIPNIIVISENKGSFKIKPATALDEGYYQCFAKNAYGIALSKVSALHRALLAPYPPSSTEQEYNVDEGDPLKMICQPTRSYPPPEYSWVVADSIFDHNPINVELSNRIQQDDKGNLYFSNVQGTDMQEGKIYKCSVHNPFIALTTTGCYSKIVVNPASPTSSLPSNVFSTPSPVVGLVGKSIELQCLFSGFPTPNVQWQRIAGSMPIDRHEIINYGTTLKITDLRYEDEGDYRCKGSNSVDKTDVIIQLNVQSVPWFTTMENQPHNINKTVGEDASFTCNAHGDPTPEVEWFKNGIAINPNNPEPRMTISDSHKKLTVHNLCKYCGKDVTDLMVIQCNSSNIHGYAYAEGYLNVLY